MIVIPNDKELEFINYFDEHIDIKEVFNNCNNTDYLQSKVMDDIDYCLSLIEKPKFPYSHQYQINRLWMIYLEICEKNEEYMKIIKKI